MEIKVGDMVVFTRRGMRMHPNSDIVARHGNDGFKITRGKGECNCMATESEKKAGRHFITCSNLRVEIDTPTGKEEVLFGNLVMKVSSKIVSAVETAESVSVSA